MSGDPNGKIGQMSAAWGIARGVGVQFLDLRFLFFCSNTRAMAAKTTRTPTAHSKTVPSLIFSPNEDCSCVLGADVNADVGADVNANLAKKQSPPS